MPPSGFERPGVLLAALPALLLVLWIARRLPVDLPAARRRGATAFRVLAVLLAAVAAAGPFRDAAAPGERTLLAALHGAVEFDAAAASPAETDRKSVV